MDTKVCQTAPTSCLQLRFGGAWQRMSLALLLMMLTTMTAWADDVNLSEDNDIAVGTAGHYYVNMPATGTNTLTITADDIADGKGTFKVYDDGGKSGMYSNDCNGNLVLIAPTGYLLQLSGSVTTDGVYDKLTVYNNNEASGTKLIDAVHGTTNINTSSTSNFMTLNFTTNAVYQGVGFDLTVTLVVAPTTYYNVTINTAEGGSVTASPTSAKINEAITLTATPGNEYMLSGISVKDADNNDVVVTWDGMFINTATFTMPGSDVTVTPTFTNDLTNLSVNMPKTGEKDVIIPSYVQSFKVYDDGGKDGNYSQNCTGTLVLTAPEGYVLQLSGNVTLDYNYEKLTVYNGTKANDDKLIDAFSCSKSDTKTDIPMATSKGNVMTIYFETNNFWEYAGLDLTVTLVSASTDFAINGLGSATGGSISASVGGENATTAKANDEVTLTATPENGYLLGSISVTDESSNPVAVTWDGPFSNTATFTMPGSNVTVTPTFTDNLTADNGLYINMPTTNNNYNEFTIPSGVQSFKVYDDGGENGTYSNNYEGTLVLTAPTGYVLQLSGGITTEGADKLTVYDNNEASGTKLIDAMGGNNSTKKDFEPVTSTGNAMTIYFKSDYSMTFAGLDLTVTLFKDIAACDITVPNQTLKGPNDSFENISYKFDYVNNNYSQDYAQEFIAGMGVVVKDGDNTLTLGTDYTFGSVKMANGDPIPEKSAIGDECMVEIIGQGYYDGSKWKTFKIAAPDANGTWGDNGELTWAFHDGTLTISPTENVQTPVAMKKANKGDYPWFSVANYIQTITIEEGVSTVADDAFNRKVESNVYGSVTTVSLPSTLTTIGNNAFAYCSALPSVVIPASVTSIGTTAFDQCGNLNYVTLNSNPTIGEYAFNQIKDGATVTMNLAAAEVDGAKWTTFYNNGYNFQADENTTVYKGTVNESSLMLTEVEDKIVNSGTAVILKSSGNPVMTLTESGSSDTNGNALKGLSERTKISESAYSASTIYVMGNTTKNGFGFHKYTGEYMPANKAFLALSSAASAPLRMVIDDEEETTGIASMADGIDDMSDEWYTLDGRKLNGKPTTKGLYIVNGKKVMIK